MSFGETQAKAAMGAAEISSAAAALEGEPLEAVLRWAAARFPDRIGFATGFGVEGCLVIDAIARARLSIDVFTLDTGLLFPETYELWRALEQRYQLKIRAVRPAQTVEEQAAAHGLSLWESAPDRCCELRKILPLRAELPRFDAWITAIRREQTKERADAKAVERDPKFGLVKVNPLVRWTNGEVWERVRAHQIPYNPLHDRGYPSIGCAPCTTPVREGEDPRAGRWRASAKTECGLHGRFALPVAAQPIPPPSPKEN